MKRRTTCERVALGKSGVHWCLDCPGQVRCRYGPFLPPLGAGDFDAWTDAHSQSVKASTETIARPLSNAERLEKMENDLKALIGTVHKRTCLKRFAKEWIARESTDQRERIDTAR